MSHLALSTKLPATLPPQPSSLRNSLRALVGLVSLLVVACAAAFLIHLRGEELADAWQRADAAARLLDEHVSRTFRATEFVIDQVVELASDLPMDQLSRSRVAWDRLQRLKNGLPEPGTLWIADAHGKTLLGTVRFPQPPTDISDRYYFSAHLQARRNLVIGPLVQTKGRDMQAFHLSKRIEAADGRLLGVALAGADAQSYTDFYHSLALGPHSAITLLDLDGRVILRQPGSEEWAGKEVGEAHQPTLNPEWTTGRFVGISPLDGRERMISWRRIDRLGIIVLAAVATEDALAEWNQAVHVVGLGLALVGLGLALLGLFAFRSLDREEALVASLEGEVAARTQEAMIQAAAAQRANESKTRYLAAASHDLRQPLQAAGMFVEVLSVRMGDSPHHAIVDKLRQSIEATQTLLSTLLDASTLEAGKVEANPQTFPLAPMMAGLMDQVDHEACAKGLRLRAVPTDAQVHSDPVLLERMLRNLLVNAVCYTDSGGVLLGCRHRGDQLAIQVVDTGCGIPADMLEAAFADFGRLGDKGAGTSRGLGLGLGVVRRMASLLGHGLIVTSEPGRGSCFTVLVPLARDVSRG